MTITHLWAFVSILATIRVIYLTKRAFPQTWKRSAPFDAVVILAAITSLTAAALK